MNGQAWTKEQVDWLVENAPLLKTVERITASYNNFHDNPRSYNSIKSAIRKHSVPVRVYTESERKWLQENFLDYPDYAALTEAYNLLFARDKSVDCISKYLNDHDLIKPEAEAPVGTVVFTGRKSYIKLRLTGGSGKQTGYRLPYWENYSKFMYRQYNGEIPDGHRIAHLNMNHEDFSRENLYACSDYVMAQMMANKWWNENPELTLSAIKCCELMETIRNFRRCEQHD